MEPAIVATAPGRLPGSRPRVKRLPSVLPDMTIPFAPVLHPAADQIERNGIAWLSRFASPAAVEHVAKARAGRIAARTCSADASGSVLRAYTQMLEWGFWFDDEFVDDLPAGSARHLPAITSVLGMLDGRDGTGMAGSAMEAALGEMMYALRQALPAVSYDLWRCEMRLWFTSMTLQNAMRSAGTVPGLAAYKTMRQYSVCTMPCIVIIDASWGFGTDLRTYWHPQMSSLRIRAANVVAWQNDIFSYHAERGHPGCFWNLPAVYLAHGLDEEQAIEQAARDARTELDAFQRAERQLGPVLTAAQDRHLRRLTNWRRGGHDWSHAATARYIGRATTPAASSRA